MAIITRRSFLRMGAAMAATAAWGSPFGTKSRLPWQERRDLFPQGFSLEVDRLKRLLAELLLDKTMLQDIAKKSGRVDNRGRCAPDHCPGHWSSRSADSHQERQWIGVHL